MNQAGDRPRGVTDEEPPEASPASQRFQTPAAQRPATEASKGSMKLAMALLRAAGTRSEAEGRKRRRRRRRACEPGPSDALAGPLHARLAGIREAGGHGVRGVPGRGSRMDASPSSTLWAPLPESR